MKEIIIESKDGYNPYAETREEHLKIYDTEGNEIGKVLSVSGLLMSAGKCRIVIQIPLEKEKEA